MAQCNFKGAVLRDAVLRNAHAPQALFPEADLSRVDARGAHFDQSLWIDAKLAAANFGEASMQQCIFHRADCTGTSFASANLTYADFSGAALEGANFDARLFRTQLHGARDVPSALRGHAGVLPNDPDLFEAERWSAQRNASSIPFTKGETP
jgi:uncharacterized protein YjbI with pentapeptide repeats